MSVQDFCLLCPGRDGPPEPRPGYWWASTYLKLWVVSVLCHPLPFSEIIFSWWRILTWAYTGGHEELWLTVLGSHIWPHTSEQWQLHQERYRVFGSWLPLLCLFPCSSGTCFSFCPCTACRIFRSKEKHAYCIWLAGQIRTGWKMAFEKPTTLKHKPQQIPSRPRAQHHWSLYLAGSSHNCRQETWSLSSTTSKESQDQQTLNKDGTQNGYW